MYRVCIILWDGAIIGVYTKEKIINTYPPLFNTLSVAVMRQMGCFLVLALFYQGLGDFIIKKYDVRFFRTIVLTQI